MSKDKKNTEQTEVNNLPQTINLENVAEIAKNGNMGKMLGNLKKGLNLNGDYLKMEKGETRRFFAAQMTTLKTTTNEAVLMIDEDNNTIIAAQTVIVGSLKSFLPCAVEIEFVNSVKLQGGKSYDKFNISRLEM